MGFDPDNPESDSKPCSLQPPPGWDPENDASLRPTDRPTLLDVGEGDYDG